MESGGGSPGRKRSIIDRSNTSSKKTRQRKDNDNFSCETHQCFRPHSCEHHVMNTSMLQGEHLRKDFAKKLIKPQAVNLCSSVTSTSRDVEYDKTSTNAYHHDDLYHNHLNTVQLPWQLV